MAPSRKTQDKDVVSRLTVAGEDALQRVSELPGGKAILKLMGDGRDRIDEMGKKLRRIDPLERRVSAVEKRLALLEKPKSATTRRRTATRKSTTRAKPKPKPPAA
jgi:hypothetical protein